MGALLGAAVRLEGSLAERLHPRILCKRMPGGAAGLA
jgi:hypothetical protein